MVLNFGPRQLRLLRLWTNSIWRRYRMIQGLPDRTANAGVLTLLGAKPIAPRIHQARFSLLWQAIRTDSLCTHRIISCQYALNIPSSWVSETASLLQRYNLPPINELLLDLPSKRMWKKMVKEAVSQYWSVPLTEEIKTKPTLKFLSSDSAAATGTHPVWSCGLGRAKITRRSTIRAKLLTGTYTLQGKSSHFNQNAMDPTCKMCYEVPEDRNHFVVKVPNPNKISERLHIRRSKVLVILYSGGNFIHHIMQDDASKSVLLLNSQYPTMECSLITHLSTLQYYIKPTSDHRIRCPGMEPTHEERYSEIGKHPQKSNQISPY